jgi:hypothetical protein
MNASFIRRLEAAERAAANLPVVGAISPELRDYLRTLTNDQLEAVERVAELAQFAPRPARRPAERLTDQEAVEEWRRLSRGTRSN